MSIEGSEEREGRDATGSALPMPLPPVVQQPVLNRDEIVVQLKNGLRAPDWPGRREPEMMAAAVFLSAFSIAAGAGAASAEAGVSAAAGGALSALAAG